MLTDKTLTFATANLFNFVEPPSAFYDFDNIYEKEAWEGKCRWTKNRLMSLDADIIGLQEVFSIEAARRLCAEMGFPHFATVETPHVEDDYIYSKPVVAIASKFPIKQVKPVTPLAELFSGYPVLLPEFCRHPIFAIVEVPELGDIAVYVCHLKSQRPTESDDNGEEQPLVGHWLSFQQRGWEAVMLRLFMEHEYQNSPCPTVLMGDMNQSLDSDSTGLLVKDTGIERGLRLVDSWQVYNAEGHFQRTPTHYHFANGNVLDYILVSQEFQANSQVSLADIIDYQVTDTHLINPSYEQDKYASDHAFVSITTRFVL
ncbi:endonuclease [Vibrio caribbeanicus]|uniref:Endonuclease n=1 Tax=Vibrio caribbeanicus TaxID=701175 RepID=A0ACC4NVR9_9VIBR|nr:endonuclease/exonuclease/phosphatase family protein [Vibrio caribbeanicus]KHD24670.1 endonuclease [Vibrio caribbeanicus]